MPTSTNTWDISPPGTYTCPNTGIDGYCILPTVAAAQAYCATDPNCTGYLTSTNPKWLSQFPLYPGVAQVTSVASVIGANPGTAPSQFFEAIV